MTGKIHTHTYTSHLLVLFLNRSNIGPDQAKLSLGCPMWLQASTHLSYHQLLSRVHISRKTHLKWNQDLNLGILILEASVCWVQHIPSPPLLCPQPHHTHIILKQTTDIIFCHVSTLEGLSPHSLASQHIHCCNFLFLKEI